jgi:cell division septal protein FtsQ
MKKKYYSKKHKEKKGKKAKIKTILYSLLFILLIFGIGYFTRMEQFKIKEVNISGTDDEYIKGILNLVEDSLSKKSFLWIVSRGSIFTYNKNEIKKDILKNFPKVDRLIINKGGDNNLDIKISEREADYLWCTKECYLADIEGVAYEIVDEQYTAGDLLRVKDDISNINLGEYVYEKEDFDNINILVKNIEKRGNEIVMFNILKDTHFNILLDTDTILKFTALKDLEDQFNNYDLTFSEKNNDLNIEIYEYIDLRFDNKVYTKKKEEVEIEVEI